MAFSRQFKALGRIAGFFAVAWGAMGTLLSVLDGRPFVPSLLTFGVMFGAVGGISGITTGLLIAKAESGRRISEVPTWRVTLWGFLGAFAPAALVTLGPPVLGTAVPLLVLGLISGGIGGALLGSTAAAAAKRVELREPDERPRFPTT